MSSTLAIELHGSGDPIVFIHGLGGTSNVFTPQVQVLSRFFTCVRPDLPGAGRSAPALSVSIESLAHAVLGVLDQSAIATPVHLIAHSMGTLVAQQLALQAPHRVRSLSLIGPLQAPTDATREAMHSRIASVRAEGMTAVADTLAERGTSVHTQSHRPEVAAFVRELLMRQDPAGYIQHCEALANAGSWDPAEIPHPVLLITGDEDGTSPALAAAALASRFPQAQLRIVSRCGHWAPLERSTEVTHTLLEFLVDHRMR